MRKAKNTYFGSALLFRVMKFRLQQLNPTARVTDLNVGALFGLDSANTSHWKKGKTKGPRDIIKLRHVCRQLAIPLDEAVDILEGEVPLGFEREARLLEMRL